MQPYWLSCFIAITEMGTHQRVLLLFNANENADCNN